MLLDEETFQKFGYHLRDLAQASHKKVVCFCPECEQPYETQRRYYREGRLCQNCQLRLHSQDATTWAAMRKHHEQNSAMGLNSKGVPFQKKGNEAVYQRSWRETNPEKAKQQNREAMRRQRQTLLGKAINRLRVSLSKYAQGKGGFSALPYTPAELQAHIQAKLEERQYLCPMCGASLLEKFDIDHRIPLSSAKTVDEVIALFALANLDVLCPPCNQHKKKAKRLEY